MSQDLSDSHELFASIRQPRGATVSKIPQLKIGDAGRDSSGIKPLLYIYETATSFRTRKDIFTGTSLLIEDLSHSTIHWYDSVELCLPFNILITGQTGTGKTQMARQIHRLSLRAKKPFIELNCANLPEPLVEAELFGHRRGAFTGADHERKGLFEEADGEILFLDEIGDIPLTLQNRLLKPIEEKQVKRIGSNQYQTFDVQIIAATSRNLPAMIRQCEFRADLYWRLALLSIEASPLSTRRQDIPAMIGLFLRQASELISARSYTPPFHVQDAALEVLCNADYPGNIRTLRNLIYTLASRVSDQEPSLSSWFSR